MCILFILVPKRKQHDQSLLYLNNFPTVAFLFSLLTLFVVRYSFVMPFSTVERSYKRFRPTDTFDIDGDDLYSHYFTPPVSF